MPIQSRAQHIFKSWRLFALCVALCAPLFGIESIQDSFYRACSRAFPAMQAKVNSDLFMASRGGDLARVKRTLNRGANIEAFAYSGFSPLFRAIQSKHFDVAFYLIQRGANVNETVSSWGSTAPLFEVVLQRGSPELAEALIAHGAKVDWQDSDGFSPLTLAAMQGNAPMVKSLIRAGANLYLKDKHNLIALERARYAQQTATVRLLENAMRAKKANPRA